jgi:aryl-alcohol dehydrogenase-like predicted oxidoreductase
LNIDQIPNPPETSLMATTEGTRRYAERLKNLVSAQHFTEAQGLTMSSIGIGTYLGEADEATDDAYRAAVVRAVQLGANVIDTAINYRFQRSERSVGDAVRDLLASGTVQRDELIIATKAGFLTFDGAVPEDPRHYIQDTLMCTGVIEPCDIAAGSHCMTPRYLEHQIHRSLENLGINTLDIFYIHNPETQLADIDRDEFIRRLRAAFEYLERAVQDGKIRRYGLATWNAFRVPTTARDAVSIEAAVLCAHSIAADNHHFRYLQLPYNLGMPEAFSAFKSARGWRIHDDSRGLPQAGNNRCRQRCHASKPVKQGATLDRLRLFRRSEIGCAACHPVCSIDAGNRDSTGWNAPD